MGGSTVRWNFCKWDWEELLRILIPVFFAIVLGILLAFVTGALIVQLLFNVLLG